MAQMEQTAMSMGLVAPLEVSRRSRGRSAPLVLTLEVTDPDVVLELRRREDDDDERDRYALAALRVGVLALRAAGGQIDAAAVREAGVALIGDVRELLSTRASEMTERLSSTLTQYLDPQSGVLPQRLQSLVRKDGELENLLRAHVGADDSILARSLTTHLGEGSPIFRLLSPTDANGLRAQLGKTIEDALLDQRKHILREFSLDQKDSALSRLVAEFSLDDDTSALSRLSKMLTATSEQIGRNLTLDDDTSALSRLKRELAATIEKLARDNVEFHAQVREALARLDTRRKEEARTPRHGVAFEERLGALLADEARRLGDVHEATGETTGAIKQCKKGDHVVELGADSAAANARIVWEAKEKQDYSLRAALEEIEEARRNRQAQVGVFVFSRKAAPEAIESLQRHGTDVVVVWDSEDPGSDLVVRAAYSLARALAVRERRTDRESLAAIAEIERAARSVEKQIGYLDDVRKWAETVKGHGEKIVERSARMAEELRLDVERLEAQIASMRTASTEP
jgi:G:T-mismatch repair DNA endonuclease (very short patch repair protein)